MIPISKIRAEQSDEQQTIENIVDHLAGAAQTDGRLVMCIGSSILAQGITATVAKFGYDVVGAVEWAARLTGQRFRHVNRAISAKTTSDMTGWLQKEILDHNPAVVIVQNATNEVGLGFETNRSVAKNMYDAILDSGAHLIVSATLPRNKAASSWTDDELRDAIALNVWKRRYCENNPRAHYAAIDKYIVDPTDASGQPIANMLHDGTHLNGRGAHRVGKVYAEILEVLIPPMDVLNPAALIVGTGYDYGCISVNPAMAGTGGTAGSGASGDVPDDWQVEYVSGTTTGAAACSVAAKSALDPTRELSIEFTPGAGGDEEFYIRTAPSGTTPAAFTDFFEALGGIDVAAWAGWKEIYLEVDDVGTGNRTYYDLVDAADHDILPEVAWDGVLRTVPFLASDGDLRFRFRVVIDGAASSTGTLKISLPQLNRLETADEFDGPVDYDTWRSDNPYA